MNFMPATARASARAAPPVVGRKAVRARYEVRATTADGAEHLLLLADGRWSHGRGLTAATLTGLVGILHARTLRLDTVYWHITGYGDFDPRRVGLYQDYIRRRAEARARGKIESEWNPPLRVFAQVYERWLAAEIRKASVVTTAETRYAARPGRDGDPDIDLMDADQDVRVGESGEAFATDRAAGRLAVDGGLARCAHGVSADPADGDCWMMADRREGMRMFTRFPTAEGGLP